VSKDTRSNFNKGKDIHQEEQLEGTGFERRGIANIQSGASNLGRYTLRGGGPTASLQKREGGGVTGMACTFVKLTGMEVVVG